VQHIHINFFFLLKIPVILIFNMKFLVSKINECKVSICYMDGEKGGDGVASPSLNIFSVF
jgi:hypothetical protein